MFVAFLITFYVCHKQFIKDSAPFKFLASCWALCDFLSDCFFLSFLRANEPLRHLFYVGLPFLLVSALGNACLLRHRHRRLRQTSPEFVEWVREPAHRRVVVAVSALSLTNIAVLGLLHSQILGLDIFSAPIPPRQRKKIDRDSLVSILLEDLPQLAVQLAAVPVIGESLSSGNVLVPLIFTAVSLVAGLGRGVYILQDLYLTSEKWKHKKASALPEEGDGDGEGEKIGAAGKGREEEREPVSAAGGEGVEAAEMAAGEALPLPVKRAAGQDGAQDGSVEMHQLS